MSDLTKWIDTIPGEAFYNSDDDPGELTEDDYQQLRAELEAGSVAPVNSLGQNARSRKDTFSDDALRQLVAGGLTTSVIADQLGVSWTTVRNRAKYLGLTVEHGVSGVPPILLPYEAEIRTRLEKSETVNAIAASLGASPNTLTKFILRYRLRHNA